MSLCTVTLEDLSPENKRRAWEYLKQHDPNQAALIKSDPIYKQLKETFNAKTPVEIDDSILLRPATA